MHDTYRATIRRAALALLAGTLLVSSPALAGQTVTESGAVSYYEIQRAPTPIQVDGSMDELGWQLAAQSNGFHRILSHYDPITRPTRAKMLWDDTALYFGFACTDPDIWAIFAAEDDPMWSEEVVEVFIDPDGDGTQYLELEVNPLNAWVDLHIQRVAPRFESDIDWDIAGLQTAVQVHGTVNDSVGRDVGWTVEIAIPWTAFGSTIGGGGRPEPGDTWRLNLYRIERMGGRALKGQLDALQAQILPLRQQLDALRAAAADARLTPAQQRQVAALEAQLLPLQEELEPLQDHYEQQTEYTAWSETWQRGFHDPARFGVVRFGE